MTEDEETIFFKNKPERAQMDCLLKVRSDMGEYAGAEHCCIYLETVLLQASIGQLPRLTPGLPCPYSPDRTPPDTTMKSVDVLLAWSSNLDIDKKASSGWDPPEGVAPHAHRGIVGAHKLCR